MYMYTQLACHASHAHCPPYAPNAHVRKGGKGERQQGVCCVCACFHLAGQTQALFNSFHGCIWTVAGQAQAASEYTHTHTASTHSYTGHEIILKRPQNDFIQLKCQNAVCFPYLMQ